jgi:hypothetical protein
MCTDNNKEGFIMKRRIIIIILVLLISLLTNTSLAHGSFCSLFGPLAWVCETIGYVLDIPKCVTITLETEHIYLCEMNYYACSFWPYAEFDYIVNHKQKWCQPKLCLLDPFSSFCIYEGEAYLDQDYWELDRVLFRACGCTPYYCEPGFACPLSLPDMELQGCEGIE